MKRAFVFIDYDAIIRHFVMSDAFRDLERKYEVTYVFHTDATSDKKGIYADVEKLGLSRVIYFDLPRKRMGSWDKLYQITALANQRGTSHYEFRRWQIANVRGWPRTRYYELLSLPVIFPIIQRKLMKEMGVYEPLRDFLAEQKPDIVIHPSLLTGYFINELTQICPLLNIPLIILMNSWDNPSSKALNTGIPDKLVVWGEQTRRHAIEFLRMPADRITAFGAAQFQVYREPIAETDEELRSMFGVPRGVPVVLYAGVSKSIDETSHLLMLDEAITRGDIPPAHIIYRPHPWRGRLVEGEKGFFDVAFRHVSIDPHMSDYYRRAVQEEQLGFELADYRVTAKLLRLVGGVISPLSTMLLEAAMHGIPCIMFSSQFDMSSGANYVRNSTKMAHFAEFWGPEGIQIVADPAKLSEACRRMLVEHQSSEIRDRLIQHANKYVVMDGPRYDQRLASLVDEIVADYRSQSIAA